MVTQSLSRKAEDTHMQIARMLLLTLTVIWKHRIQSHTLQISGDAQGGDASAYRNKVVWEVRESIQKQHINYNRRAVTPLQNLARSLSVLVSIMIQLRFQKRHGSNVNMQPKLAWGLDSKPERNKATERTSGPGSSNRNYPGLARLS